jgi:hypothetical protein
VFFGRPGFLIEKSKNSNFDYWGSIDSQWKKYGRICFPVKSHRKLNEALKDGWILKKTSEVIKDKNGRFYLRIFIFTIHSHCTKCKIYISIWLDR